MKLGDFLIGLGIVAVGVIAIRGGSSACSTCPPRGTTAKGATCTCTCHSQPGIVHVMACCTPPASSGVGAILGAREF